MKKELIIIMLSISVLLTGCNFISNIFSGSDEGPSVFDDSVAEGLKFHLNSNDDLIVGDMVNLEVEVQNRGNYDNPQGTVYLSGFDKTAIYFQRTNMVIPQVFGRSSQSEGEIQYIEFRETNGVRIPFGDRYSPTIQLHACYDYQTKAESRVCVISQVDDIREILQGNRGRESVCSDGQQEVFAQHAPVIVKSVNERIGRDFIQFIITIENLGQGRVVNKREINKCPFELNLMNVDVVRYEISMSDFGEPDCLNEENEVRLNDGEGTIVCTFAIRDRKEPYQTPLSITLDYGYTQSVQKQITIEDPLYIRNEQG